MIRRPPRSTRTHTLFPYTTLFRAAEVAAARETLGWTAEPFVIPADIAAAWAAFGETGKALTAEWNERLATSEKKTGFEARIAGKATPGAAFRPYLERLGAEPSKVVSRKASENTLLPRTAEIADLVGGSAESDGSHKQHHALHTTLTAEVY